MFAKGGGVLGAIAAAHALPDAALRALGGSIWLTEAYGAVALDPNDPTATFTYEGQLNGFTAGTVLIVKDAALNNVANFFAADPDAAGTGPDLDVVVTFQVRNFTPSGADHGVRFVVNEGGIDKAVIAACIIKGGQRGIGLAAGNLYFEESNYPVFVPADWTSLTSVRIRRTQAGGEIISVNGVAPDPQAFLPRSSLPPRTRTDATVEFGSASAEAVVEVDIHAFASVRVGRLAAQVQPPIDADGSSTFNAKRGVVPIKFALSADGSSTCELPAATLRLTRTGGASPGLLDESLYTGSPDAGTEFRISDCQYHYNLDPRPLGVGVYLAEILIDGTAVGSGRFELK